MNYLYTYLVLGVLVISTIQLRLLYKRRGDHAEQRDFTAASRTKNWRNSDWVIDHLFILPVACVVAICIWPIGLFWKLSKWFDREEGPSNPEGSVVIRPGDLIERLNIGEIEAREMVADPLKAVPELPFGHLHPVWKRFLQDCTDHTEIWSFNVRSKQIYGRIEQTSGYVAVTNGEMGTHILLGKKWRVED